ncbi:tRNA (adenosine(37)-N6)-threonylcarbamoyltransferase complex dimerization subunit type 1 TsaB [candidate division TM6 bacterium RIFCSPHIGHO2_12_FULL_38_8]|nr:MAG: tRNA (adenosine(37)-N6)-threonylcarbamoyltransferase complex dimerization subunit type 1 TsaB [candidate division TM6 bacterium RIFCSPHIGHO2_12_FULL_38_8]
MQHYLILQYPYDTIQIALCQQGKIIQEITEHKFNAIRRTIPNMQALLDQHNLKLSEISCIGVNVGPGPYNTLRALLTMANGIHFAAKIPLISCNALKLLEFENQTENSLVILHAFLDHVFYRMKINNAITEGNCHISELIKIINQQKTSSIVAIGNGAEMHKALLIDQCKNLKFLEKTPAFNALQTLAEQIYEKLKHKDFEKSYVQPIYFDKI